MRIGEIMGNPAVSVIVPVFNRRHLIRRAIDSLLKQDFTGPYEIIVVDDGSTDGSVEVIENIDVKVRILRQHNRGAAVARYLGMCEARADILAFLDSDDIATPCHLSALWEGLQRRSDIVLAYAKYASIDGKLLQKGRFPADLDNKNMLMDPLKSLVEFGCFFAALNIMTYRKLAIQCARGQAKYIAANDYALALKLANYGPFAFVDALTLIIDHTDDGISRSKGALQVGFAVLAIEEAVKKSGRNDSALRLAIRKRIELLWPSAVIKLLFLKQIVHCLKVLGIAVKYARLHCGFKPLYWALCQELSKSKSAGISK